MRRKDWKQYVGTSNNYGIKMLYFEIDKEEYCARDIIVCLCPKCKNEFKAQISNALNQKSCKECSRKITGEKTRHHTTIGFKFGKYTVKNIFIENGRTICECECECGKINIIPLYNLEKENGTRMCVSCRNKEISKNNIKEIQPGTIINFLKAIKPGPFSKRGSTTLFECLNCGTKKVIPNVLVRKENVKSCGCITSMGEKLTKIELEKYNIETATQYTFPDLIGPGGGLLKFDFVILKNGERIALLEYQGNQHTKDTGDFGRLQREITDKMKKDYCKEHNIILYEIFEGENIEYRVKEILTDLKLIE